MSTRHFPAVLASGDEKSGNSSGNLITEPVKIEPMKFKESVSSQSGHRWEHWNGFSDRLGSRFVFLFFASSLLNFLEMNLFIYLSKFLASLDYFSVWITRKPSRSNRCGWCSCLCTENLSRRGIIAAWRRENFTRLRRIVRLYLLIQGTFFRSLSSLEI